MQEFKLPKLFNWQTASDKLVKKYVADLYQTNIDAPVATELFNNTGIAFTYEYISTGFYVVTANKDIFTGPTPGQSVQVSISNSNVTLSAISDFCIIAVPSFYNAITIVTLNNAGDADDILGNALQNLLEITFYNK
jgi:hypothetical protein